MPLYEFQCKSGHRIELIIPLTDFTEQVACIECYNKSGRIAHAKLVPSMTGPPKFKRGGAGGFYKPSKE
jgi:hypothetical protein